MKSFLEWLIVSLLMVLILNHLVSCVAMPKGQYHVASKKQIQTFNPSSPRAYVITFKNDKGSVYRKYVFMDTFALGDCFYFVKHKP